MIYETKVEVEADAFDLGAKFVVEVNPQVVALCVVNERRIHEKDVDFGFVCDAAKVEEVSVDGMVHEN